MSPSGCYTVTLFRTGGGSNPVSSHTVAPGTTLDAFLGEQGLSGSSTVRVNGEAKPGAYELMDGNRISVQPTKIANG